MEYEMKKFTKTNLLSTTAAIATIFVSSLSYACPANEVCDGLDLTINDDRIINIDGLGGIDLSDVNVSGAGDINVELPETVENAIEVSQTNSGDVKAKLDYKGQFIAGDFESKVAAIGNNVSVDLTGSNAIEGGQNNTGNISAESFSTFSLSHDSNLIAQSATLLGFTNMTLLGNISISNSELAATTVLFTNASSASCSFSTIRAGKMSTAGVICAACCFHRHHFIALNAFSYRHIQRSQLLHHR
jgi:hypothetical protein